MRVYNTTRIDSDSVNIKDNLVNLAKSDIDVLKVYAKIEDIGADLWYSARRINSVIDNSTKRLAIGESYDLTINIIIFTLDIDVNVLINLIAIIIKRA